MLKIVVPLIIGLLMIIGGCYTIVAAKRYFKNVKTEGTDNVFSPLAIYYVFAIGFMMILVGISVLCVMFS